MKRLLFLLLLALPLLAAAQFPANPNKIRLGYQTTGEGIIYYGSGAPAFTPTSRNNAFHYQDTTANIFYYYDFQGDSWETVLPAADGNGIISALPLGPVAINADTNTLAITNLDDLILTGSGTFTIQKNGVGNFNIKAPDGDILQEASTVDIDVDTSVVFRVAGTPFFSVGTGGIGVETPVLDSATATTHLIGLPGTSGIATILPLSTLATQSALQDTAAAIRGDFPGSPTVYYQTLRDDGTPLTQRDAINFVGTSTVATTLTDDAGSGETEVALSVPTGAIGPTELASTAVTPGSYIYGGFTVDADGRLTAASSGTAPVTGSGVSGQVTYWNGTTTITGESTFNWDAANDGLIIGAAALTTDVANSSLEIFGSIARQYNIGTASSRLSLWGKSQGANIIWNIGGTTLPTSSFYTGNQTGTGSIPMLTTGIRSGNFGDPGDGDILKIRGDTKYVGIGLSNGAAGIPLYPLHIIANSAAVEDVFVFENNVTPGIPNKMGFLLRTRDASAGNQVSYGAVYAVPNASGAGTYDGALSFWTAINASFAERGRFNTDGAFLVGTTSTPTGAVGAFNGGSLQVKGAGATSATVALLAENSAGTDLLYLDNSGQLGLLTNLPARTLHVAGEARITDLTTDTPTRIVGADADGDLNEITVSSELDLTGGVLSVGVVSHSSLSDLGSPEDDHPQYLHLPGRVGGQTVYGGDAASTDLDLNSTSNATKGNILLQDEGGNVIIGGAATASRLRMLEASGSGTNYTEFVTQAQAANVTYTLPADDGDAGEYMHTDGAGVLSWEGADVHGRVLYVSTAGNDATAEIGNILKPYDDPFAAYTAATDGDLIYIFPGTYSPGTVDFGGKSLNYYLCQGAVLNGPYWNPSAKRVIRIDGRGSIVVTTTPVFRVEYGSVFTVDVDSIAHSGTYTVRTGNGYISMKARVVRKSTVNTSFVFAENSDLTGRTFDIDINTFLSVDGSVIALYNTTPEDVNGAVNIKYLRKVSTVTAPVYNVFEAGCTRCDIALNIEVITVTGTNSTHGFVYLDTKTFLLTNSTFRFNVGTYTGEHQFFQYINTAEEIDSTSKFLLDCKNCIYTGDYSALWRRNQNQESYMPIYVSGKWESVDNSILSDSTSTNTWAVPIIFENAELKVRNGAYYAIHIYGFDGTTGGMEFRNTVFKGQNSGVAAISCATASEFITAGAYQGNTTVDGDATFTTLFKLE